MIKNFCFVADVTLSVLRCFSRMVPTIEVHSNRIEAAMNTGHILATKLRITYR